LSKKDDNHATDRTVGKCRSVKKNTLYQYLRLQRKDRGTSSNKK